MADTVIVALPSEDELVNKVSSEKKAHLTLCVLGDLSNSPDLESIVLYVQHAAAQLSPFWMSVDYRGTLGPKDADVLFFKKHSHHENSRIMQFRHFLLLNDAIKMAYDSVTQYPEWTPHITLGYPDAPANKIPDNDPPKFYGIEFDRIAIWTGDFEGPEFRLQTEDFGLEAAWSDIPADELGARVVDELFHHGVKGQKWGVRNDKGHEGERAKTRVIAKADKKFEKAAGDFRTHMKIYNDSIPRANKLLDEVNNKPEYKDADFSTPSALRAQYHFEVQNTMVTAMTETVQSLGTNASGTRKYNVYFDDDGQFYLSTGKVEHSALNPNDIPIPVIRNAKGLIVKFGSLSDVEHSDLAHFGVKGMRWGVTTKDKAHKTTPTDVVVTQDKPGKFAKTSGGEKHPLHDDAAKALVARQKAKASTTDALSNAELRSAVERMQLEQKYNQLSFSSDRRSRGARFIAGLFGQRKETKFRDLDEEAGDKIRKAIKEANAQKTSAGA